MDFGAIENAIHAWVVAGSGLLAANVIWAGQGGPEPTGRYISIRLPGLRRIGSDWKEYSGGLANVVTSRGVRTMTLSLQTFNGAPLGNNSNLATLERVISAAADRELLAAGGVGLGSVGAITVIDGDRSSLLDPRAVVDVVIHLASETLGTGTTIEHVEATNQITGQTVVIDRP